MPMYDFECLLCERTFESLRRISDPNPPCRACGHATRKVLLKAPGVIADGVPGGFVVENIGSTPMRFDSKSEYRRELEKRGLEQRVRHVGEPGSDKSPHTTSWAGFDPLLLAPSCVLPPELRPKPEPLPATEGVLVTDHPLIDAARPKTTTDIVADTYRELGGL
jgi:putative FmdB family regulatory protein